MNTAADLHMSPDGRYLYASNRGHDSLAAFAVSEQDGTLTPAGQYPCGGRTPRHFWIGGSGRYVLAANQDSDNIAILGRDGESGALYQTAEVFTGMPVCVCPYQAAQRKRTGRKSLPPRMLRFLFGRFLL